MKTIGLIGLGRFGQTLAQLFSDDFIIKAYDIRPPHTYVPVQFVELHEVLKQSTIFIAVPIRSFASVIENIANDLSPLTTIIDVCSVKVYPVKVMQQFLPTNIGFIASHPLFGPDSIKTDQQLKMIMYPTHDIAHQFSFWKDYFSTKNIGVMEMPPEQHDRYAAFSQGLTHFIGRSLDEGQFKNTPIDTLGFRKLMQVVSQTANDSWELFEDLQRFNPYTSDMLAQFENAIKEVKSKLKI